MNLEFLRAAAKRLKNHATLQGNEPLPPVVLCADDDDAIRTLCTAVLSRGGFRTDTARNGREALQRLEDHEYAAVLLDLGMPYLHGATVMALLARDKPAILRRIIIMTGLPSAATNAYDGVVGATLRKPMRNEELIAAVRACCEADSKNEPSPASLPFALQV